MIKSPSSLLLVLILAALAYSSLAEVLVITSDEENTLPVFEVYDVTEDRVRTVQKVGCYISEDRVRNGFNVI